MSTPRSKAVSAMTSAMKDSQNQAGVPSQSANRNSMLLSLDMPSAPPFGSALDRQLYGSRGREPAAATTAKHAESARRAAPPPSGDRKSAAQGKSVSVRGNSG